MAETLSAVERILKISVFPFHSRVAAFAQCNQIGKLVSFLPIRKIMEAYNMVDFKTLFSRFLTATAALIIVPFPGKPCLLFPIGSIVRLIATFPTRMSFWCFPHPIIPAFSRAKTSNISLITPFWFSYPPCFRHNSIKWLMAKLATFDKRQDFSFWIRFALLRSRHLCPHFRRIGAPLATISSVIMKPTVATKLENTMPFSYLRLEYINGFAAVKTIIVNALFHNLIISRREDK